MFTLSLRGKLGLRILLIVNGSLLVAFLILFFAPSFILRASVSVSLILIWIGALVHMNRHRTELLFNSEANKRYAYPTDTKRAFWFSVFQISAVIVFFLPIVTILTVGAQPLDPPFFALLFGFIVGGGAFVDLLQKYISKE